MEKREHEDEVREWRKGRDEVGIEERESQEPQRL